MSYSPPSNDAVDLSGSRVSNAPDNDGVYLVPIASGGLLMSVPSDTSIADSEPTRSQLVSAESIDDHVAFSESLRTQFVGGASVDSDIVVGVTARGRAVGVEPTDYDSTRGTPARERTVSSEAVDDSQTRTGLRRVADTADLIDRFIENNPNLGLLLTEDEVAYYVARTIVSSVDEFLNEVEAERQQQFVATASGEGLDQLGELVGARRQTGEGDAAMRTRVRAGFGRATSETTIEDLAQITRTITGASASEIQIKPPTGDVLVVIVRVNSGILNDSPFGLEELGDFLSDVVPASHAVEVRTSGTFVLDGPDFTPPPNSGLGDGNGTLGSTSG